jgi:UrcA family protein
MKTLAKAQLIRKTLIATTAITMMTLPLLASASTPNSSPDIKVVYHTSELSTSWGRENIYEKMQAAARKICGSSNIRIAGSRFNATANEECYEGTLSAAVQRLDNEAIKELHEQGTVGL